MKVYISGPMTGIKDKNFPYFNFVAEHLRSLGVDVANPAEIEAKGTDWHDYLRADLKALLNCDAIVMIDGWEHSKGAHLEMHVAHRVGMPIKFIKEYLKELIQ